MFPEDNPDNSLGTNPGREIVVRGQPRQFMGNNSKLRNIPKDNPDNS